MATSPEEQPQTQNKLMFEVFIRKHNNMPEFGTYGMNFPFSESRLGYMFDLTDTPEEEIRANLIHLLFN